jgi:hypothetical protein
MIPAGSRVGPVDPPPAPPPMIWLELILKSEFSRKSFSQRRNSIGK